MIRNLANALFDRLLGLFGNEFWAELLTVFVVYLGILIVAVALFWVLRQTLIAFASKFATKTRTKWDDILIEHNTFKAIAHLVPAIILYKTAGFSIDFYPSLEPFLMKVAQVYLLGIAVFIIVAFLSSINDIYDLSFPSAKEAPINGGVQLAKIFVYFAGLLIFISIVFNKNIGDLVTALGAMAAVLLLVFKDTILGFTASIQLSYNRMVKVGDWVSLPNYNADGTVLEINITTVKIQNWDKTISTVPTYALVTNSFQNWKGMESSGGRRIKRFIHIDMTSVKFCDDEMLNKFGKMYLLKSYVKNKEEELKKLHQSLGLEQGDVVNMQRQTNLGIFRKYLEAYLHENPMISDDMTFLVRHLQPTETGLPIEVYVFSKDKEWANYEAIQADIFDHIIAILPEFELRIFQTPSGNDFNQFVNMHCK